MATISGFNPNARPVATGADAPARNRLRDAANEDYAFYRESFAPQTSELRRVGLGFGAGNQLEAIQSALPDAGQKFDVGAATFDRDLQRNAVRNTDAVASQRKKLGLARVLAQVDSANRASATARQNRESAQQFGLNTYGENAASAGDILGKIAYGDVDRDLQYKDAKGRSSAGKTQAIGTGLALIASLFI